MLTQRGLRKGAVLKKFVLEAHPIIQTYIEKLKIGELIASYIAQDQRMKLPIEQSLCVLIHNILTTPMPMYEIDAWLAPFRRFWTAHVDALERHLDRMEQTSRKGKKR